MKIVCISDTHGCRPPLPVCDILIHAGDLTTTGSPHQLDSAIAWLKDQPAKHKVVIAGNHDFVLQEHQWSRFLFGSMHYLQDQLLEIEGLRIWGSPWSLKFGDWAFGKTDEELEQLYSAIPPCDILVTHGPPLGILDQGYQNGGRFRPHFGSPALHRLVKRLKPRLHVFGHIHEEGGLQREEDGTLFVNAAYCPGLIGGESRDNNCIIELEL